MASRIFNAGYVAGLKRVLHKPNDDAFPGTVTKVWGVDKFISAVPAVDKTVEYGEIVKITAYKDTGATVEGIVNADTAPKFAIVRRNQDGLIARTDTIAYAPLAHVPLTIYPIGTVAAPAKDQNGEIVVVYTGVHPLGYDVTDITLYTPKLASDTTGLNGTATEVSTNNLELPLVGVGKVFAPSNDKTAKCIRVRLSGGKL